MAKKNLFIETPTIYSTPLSVRSKKHVFLKMESNQPTQSFKIRGIAALANEYKKAKKKQLVVSSLGNAGYTAAYVGRELGMKTTVILPEFVEDSLVKKMVRMGAIVQKIGKTLDQAEKAAAAIAESENAGHITPFDHPTLWKGHSTMVDEFVKQLDEKPDAIITAVGGGGLLSGLCEGLHKKKWKDVPVFAVETEGCPSFSKAVEAGEPVTIESVNTLSSSLGVRRVCQEAVDWSKKHDIRPVVVKEGAAVAAARRFLDDHYELVEPATGAPLSLLYNNYEGLKEFKNILVIVCGGVNVSINKLLTLCHRAVENKKTTHTKVNIDADATRH